ncbi:MAG TPA: acetyltransferase [Rickettsia endosymbiont of Pyrocoelia pectoralis]|nr:acetyltransferase [Rickettsia endosymbiont of Pyrocoelia pectoralis]
MVCCRYININFISLSTSDFPLLLKWLEEPHIKLWWDEDIKWTSKLIKEKYENYVEGYKKLEFQGKIIKSPIYAFIINLDNIPIGYIQYYNKNDFPLEQGYDASELPKSCAALDYYIGKTEYIGKNIGFKILSLFIERYIAQKFDYVFVDPDSINVKAIHVYKKAGFKVIKRISNESITWMIKDL